MKAKKLMTMLTAAGYKPTYKESDCPDCEDDSIDFEDHPKIHIQVGDGYYNVVKETDDRKLEFYPCRNTTGSVYMDFQKAVSE